jgi:hypothetical protein
MLVISQRWVAKPQWPVPDLKASQGMLVEALVIRAEPACGTAFFLDSVFYDPNVGQTLDAPTHVWNRDRIYSVENLIGDKVLAILTTWGLEHQNLDLAGFQKYIDSIAQYLDKALKEVANVTV